MVDSQNPLGYKFSWSPRGALLAALNSARYNENGKLVEELDILKSVKKVSVGKGYAFEGTSNRDSTKYEKLYDLKLDTLFRGTLRYQGYANCMRGFRDIGLLKQDAVNEGSVLWVCVFQSSLIQGGCVVEFIKVREK